MSMTTTSEYQADWEKVQAWPPELRLNLAQSVLGSLQGDVRQQGMRGVPATAVRGIAATDQPPPTDEQVEEWIGEHRLQKLNNSCDQ